MPPRTLQVQQWWFAGAPEHPALRRVCDHIAAHYQHRFLPHENADTLERTGPGPWTDAVLATAAEYSAPVRASAAECNACAVCATGQSRM